MESTTRLVKTPKGREEIEHRRYKLPGKLRTLLILIDGTRTIEETARDAQKLGAPEDAVIQLMREGFAAPVGDAGRGSIAVARPVDEAVVDLPPASDGGASAGGGGVPRGVDPDFEKFRNAKQFMNDTAVDNMGGLKKFTFTLKLERCSVREDLAALVDDYELSLVKSIGREAASVLVDRLKVLLR